MPVAVGCRVVGLACLREDDRVESIYLSATNPRWSPTSEREIREALEGGLLEETHYLDLKRELAPGRVKNREHARDLASFAIDGGTILVGIAEDTATGAVTLAPQPLSGLRERVESIARTIPDPPLSIVTRAVPTANDGGLGYLVVHVPASPSAPHMVDGRYVGRGDSAKYYLSDAEVLRLHERRRLRESDALAMLAREFARDPVPEDERMQAHLFVIAEPLTPRTEMMLPHLHQQGLLGLLSRGAWGDEATRALGPGERFSPELTAATVFTRRASGVALSTHGLGSDRSVDALLASQRPSNWEDVVEFEVSEDGAIRIMLGRLSDAPSSQDGDDHAQVLFDVATVVYVRRVLGILLDVADQAAYFGGWALAVGATGLRGLGVHDQFGWPGHGRFEEDTYERATTASYADIVARPGSLTDQLLGRFLRKLGTHPRFVQELSNPPTSDTAS